MAPGAMNPRRATESLLRGLPPQLLDVRLGDARRERRTPKSAYVSLTRCFSQQLVLSRQRERVWQMAHGPSFGLVGEVKAQAGAEKRARSGALLPLVAS